MERTSTRQVLRRLGPTAALLLAATLGGCGDSSFDPPPELIQRHNRAVALMDQFKYNEATRILADLVEAHPDWTEGRVDLAIARLNRREGGDLQIAKQLLRGVLNSEGEHLRARYCLALLHLHGGDPRKALPLFRAVAEADPSDAYAAYFTGKCLHDLGQPKEAKRWLQRALEIEPHLRTACYQLIWCLQQLGEKQQVKQMWDRFRKLENHPQAVRAEIKYTRMGPKAEVRAIETGGQGPDADEVPAGPLFAEAVALPIANAQRQPPAPQAAADEPRGLTLCDIDGDKRLDLFFAGASLGDPEARNAVLLRRQGGYELQPDHPLAAVPNVTAALWGDYDNDGRTDVFLCRDGPNRLMRRSKTGGWKAVTDSLGIEARDRRTVDGLFVDLDHDADLDLFLLNADGPDALLRNNADGTFTRLAQKAKVSGGDRASRAAVAADLDDDRDADLLVLHKEPPHAVYRNELFMHFAPAEGFDRLTSAPVDAAVPADLDADGQMELFTLSPDAVAHWAPNDRGAWRKRTLTDREPGGPSTAGRIAAHDLNGDGEQDLTFSASGSWAALLRSSDGWRRYEPRGPNAPLWALALLNPSRGPAVVGLDGEGKPVLWRPGEGRHAFTAFRFSGLEKDDQQPRSNASGIGVEAAVRVGSRWSAIHSYPWQSGPGQSLQPVAVGLRGEPSADFVRMLWPDGVYQTAMDMESGKLHRLRFHKLHEQRRQLSSCPVLFGWNGTRYAFATDLLGVGGVGFNVGAGRYPPPRPWENLLLPKGMLAPRNGRYELKLTQPMEEAAYIDSARLVAYDLPPGWKMTVDERFPVGQPKPTGEPRFYRDALTPAEAVNDRGNSVTHAVRHAEDHAAPPGPLDPRFIGRTAEPHGLTLRFDRALDRFAAAADGNNGNLMLVADGWVEYPYSQTRYAAWQAGAEYHPPTLEARGPDGRWHVVLKQFGYPAGMPRQIAVPIPMDKLPDGATALRLRTNMQIYWDRLRVVRTEPCPRARRIELPLDTARLSEIGFPRRTTGPQHLPRYDYSDRSPLWDTRHLRGFYTRFGDVLPLLKRTDSAVAIFGPGEGLHLSYPAPDTGPPSGWTRRLVLESAGWCKDMDLYTRQGRTLAPVPARDSLTPPEQERRQRLHDRFNTRYRAGPS